MFLIIKASIMQKKSKLELLDELIRDKHTDKLLNCNPNDYNRINQIEKDFTDDLELFGVERNESKKLFIFLPWIQKYQRHLE